MGNLFGGSGVKMPVSQAGNPKATAAPVEQLSEQARKNKILAASLLTQDWSPPKLSQPGLLGL